MMKLKIADWLISTSAMLRYNPQFLFTLWERLERSCKPIFRLAFSTTMHEEKDDHPHYSLWVLVLHQ